MSIPKAEAEAAQSTTSIPAQEQMKEINDLLAASRKLYGAPIQQYQDPIIAPESDLQIRARELAARTGQWLPFLQQAERMSGRADIGYPEQYRRYMNPYEAAAAQAVTRDVNRNFTENVLPALEAQFLKRGQHGASGHRKLVRRAQRDMQSELMARLAQMRAHGFEQGARMHESEQNRRMGLANQMAALGEMSRVGSTADIGTMQDIGSAQQRHNQNFLDAAYHQWLRREASPLEKLMARAAIFHGLPFSTSQSTMYGMPPEARMNTAGNMAGLAASVLGARMGAGAGAGSSESPLGGLGVPGRGYDPSEALRGARRGFRR
jgi:hypothetical protein